MKFCTVLCVIFSVSNVVLSLPAEPVCSKFDYEMKTMEAMLRTEQKVEKMVEETKTVREEVLQELGEIRAFKSQIMEELNTFKDEFEKQTKIEKEERKMDVQIMSGKMEEKLKLVDKALELLNDKPADPVIAFTVTNPTKKFVDGAPIFGKAITNIGDGYNMNTGIFTSPIKGLYLFTFTVASNGLNDVYCYIYHNQTWVGFGRTWSQDAYTTAAAAVYLVLSKGDEVKLSGCGGWSNLYTPNQEVTFSGALIAENN